MYMTRRLDAIAEWKRDMEWKGIAYRNEFIPYTDLFQIFLGDATFDCITGVVTTLTTKYGDEIPLNDVQEDLRDHLRTRGIKFFTGRPFKSITPRGYQ